MAEDVIENEHLDIRLREDEELDFFTELALHEAERWIQAITRKKFQYPDDFRKSLMNGILLCELLNCIKPGSVKRINKLPGPIAGLDNVNVFLRACAQSFGLNETQLFDPSDLEDLTQRAISDENETLLKQEVDRRARNVAITIYWLGRTVAEDNKTPVLDTSAFSALVHSHGNKNIISEDQFRNDSWQQLESPVKITSPTGRHIRDSSYDSLGSYEPESESSFDDLDGSMPVRSDMKGDMKRYGSAGSLNRDLHLSATSDTVYSDKNDSMYQSSPDLSQGSHAHTRSSSTDSAEGGYYGNHSRQSSGSVETYPTRRTSTSAIRKTSTTTPDPLQFVKIKGAQDLAKNAEKQIEIAKEVNKMRGVVETGGLNEEPDWQSNFKSWKSKRRQSTPAFASLGETEEEKEEKQQSVKTFKQMTQEREKRRSLGPMNFYPLEDDDFGLGGGRNTEDTITKSHNNKAQPKPKGKMSKKADVAPWARDSSGEGDSQSDSETNNSHQSGDTDSVFSDKSTDKVVPSRFVSEDDSWMKNTKSNSLQSANKVSTLPKTSRPMSENVKRWETNVQDSLKKDDKKKVDLPKNAANIRNLTKAYEQKDKDASADPVVTRRRSEFSKRSSSSSDRFDGSPMTPPWKSLDLSNKSPYHNPTNKPLSPTSPKALVPRDQRFSGSFSKDYSPSKEKPSLSPSQRSMYLATNSPPKHSKSLTFGAPGGKPSPKSMPPKKEEKPSKSKILQAKAMFDKPVEEPKPPVGRRRVSTDKDPNAASKDKVSKDKTLPEHKNEADERSETSRATELERSSIEEPVVVSKNAGKGLNAELFGRLEALSEPKEGEQVKKDSPTNIHNSANSASPIEAKDTKDINQHDIVVTNENVLIDNKGEKLNTDNTAINDSNFEGMFSAKPTNFNTDSLDNTDNQVYEPAIQQDRRDNNRVIDSRMDAFLNDTVTMKENLEDTSKPHESFGNIQEDASLDNQNDLKGFEDYSNTHGGFNHTPNINKKFTEKMIKISQKPNNNRGFGFTLAGGMEKKLPITVQRVSLGSITDDDDDVFITERSAADVNELEAKDEILVINGRDASSLTLAQVQAIVDGSVKRGELELTVKRYIEDEDEYDSMEEEENRNNQQSSINNNNSNTRNISGSSSGGPLTDNGHSYFSYPSVDNTTPTYTRPVLQVAVNADGGRPRLMDQLVKEQQQQEQLQQQQQQQQQAPETNNNDVKIEEAKRKDEFDRAPDTEVIEQMVESFSFSSQSMPKVRGLQEPVTPDMNGPPAEIVTEERSTLQMTPSRPNVPETQTVTEERPTITATSTIPEDPSPVAPRRRRTPDRTEALKVQDSPPPPTPPKAEPPPLMQYAETPESGSGGQDSGFGPPAALLRWQRPRTKSEFTNPFPSTSLDQQLKASKRLSSTLPYNSKSPINLEDYSNMSKDDTNLNKVSLDSDLSESNSSLRNTYTFGDAGKIEDWQHKQEQERQPESQISFPPLELNIRREENLTAQSAEQPIRRVGQFAAPDLSEINAPSTQAEPEQAEEKFEREQARIRQQYEEEKRQAKEAEKRKQEEEQKKLNSDKFLQKLESQVMETKQESQILNMEPIRPAPTQPTFSSEPMTIRIPANTPGRQLIIDPRNQDDTKPDLSKPQYSFHVDLQTSKPPLRSLNQEPELSQEELLERERQKIREEEMRKMEEEKQRWKEEQERRIQQEQESIRQERERLQQEQARVAQEKALLEKQRHQEEYQPSSYQSPHNYSYMSTPTSSSPSSSQSHSPKSPPPALDPKHREYKKVPPPTAPKPDKNMKARLTREDLMMMNRKPTPMTKRPEGSEDDSRSELSASIREPPTKAELHSLNAVPKPKFHNSGAWIKEEEPVTERPFVIGKRSDLIHNTTDNSNPQEHWLVREAERRRKEEQSNRMNSVTAHAGPTKPSQSSLVNHFRGDMEPPARSNRYSYPSSQSSDIHRSSPTSRPLSSSGNNLNQYERSPGSNVMQFSARTQPNSYSSPSLSQTLPASFSFNANLPPSHDQSVRSSRLSAPTSGDAEAVIAVSGKQKCSHCGEELGFGAAMVIESLGLYYHVQCFCCCVCRMPLGNGSEGADVRVRVNKLHCKNCYSNDEAGLKFSKV